MDAIFDVIIAGAGPAGAACATACAEAGLRTLVLERAQFPREKVCGDCLNPACWPVLDRLSVAERVLAAPHSRLEAVAFAGIDGAETEFPLSASRRGETAIKRSFFDEILAQRAIEAGAEIRFNMPVMALEPGWRVHAGGGTFEGRILVAADGRNSTVARLLGLLPPVKKDRVAIQTHMPAPPDARARVLLRFLPEGYCGMSPVGGGEMNLCLVSRPAQLARLKQRAEALFNVPPESRWRTITPLARPPIAAAGDALYLIGDAARVVEPFTGEGIYYALATGELAGRHIVERRATGDFLREHSRLYRHRLWINHIARAAVLRPRLGNAALKLLRRHPALLRYLTQRVIGA